MAEEQLEILQGDLDAAKTRIEELEVDLNILREQIEGPVGAPTGVDENASDSVKVKQLEKHNERLKEALIKYACARVCLIFRPLQTSRRG